MDPLIPLLFRRPSGRRQNHRLGLTLGESACAQGYFQSLHPKRHSGPSHVRPRHIVASHDTLPPPSLLLSGTKEGVLKFSFPFFPFSLSYLSSWKGRKKKVCLKCHTGIILGQPQANLLRNVLVGRSTDHSFMQYKAILPYFVVPLYKIKTLHFVLEGRN